MAHILEKIAVPMANCMPIAAGIGSITGAGLVIYQSDRRDTFLDCVGQITTGTIMGAAVGTITCFFSPLLVAGMILGGPMYAYQRFCFPPAQGKPFRHETRVGPILISRELR